MLLGEGCLQRRARKDHIMYQNIFCRALKWTNIADRLKISNKCRIADLWLLFFFLHLKVFPRVGKMWLFIRRCEGWNVIWLSPATAPRIWGAVETQKYYPHENIFTASLKLISFNNWVLNSWSTNYGCKWKYLFVFDNILIRVESCHLSRCLSIIASMFPRFSVVFKLYSTLEIFILISTCWTWTPSAVQCMPWDAKSWRVSSIYPTQYMDSGPSRARCRQRSTLQDAARTTRNAKLDTRKIL